MSAAFEHYLQPPVPDPERAPDDTTEPVGPAVDDIDGYQQPPPSMLPAAPLWLDDPCPSDPRTWEPRPMGRSIGGFWLSFAGHAFTWAAWSSPWSDWAPIALALAAVAIIAGIVASATALARHRRGLVGGSRWAGAGLVLGVLWVVVALALALWASRMAYQLHDVFSGSWMNF